ncbi:hypothetical protein L1049_018973 [Liquidambar formosana]|uniref:F-box domain-containing protein n=1 Tax=Liquidambar formosana TaxID=63359 RepID=A0AAP0RAV4_LIQFO
MAKSSKKSNNKRPKSSKTDENNGIDRISDLPEPLIHHILSFLQTVDVVRVSVLSRRWRYLWNSIPCLDFDYTLFSTGPMTYFFQFRFGEKFTDFVNRVLSAREECDIQRLHLSCFNHCNSWVDRWICDAVGRNVQELDLSFCPDDSFELPHCLQTTKLLTVLKLNLCYRVLRMPTSMGFSRLTSLHFVSLKFLNDDSAREFFRSCPLLENLIMERCVFKNLKVLDITATNLKNLTIKNVEVDSISDDGLCETELKIFAPNLVSFNYMGPVAQSYLLKNISSIASVFIQLVPGPKKASMEELGYLVCEFIKACYSTKVLKLSVTFLEYLFPILGKPECFSAPFYNLKSLKLFAGIGKLHLQVIVYLLEYFPNLEALAIDFKETSKWNDYWQPQDGVLTCLMYHLKTVEIDNVKGQENELGLISFLLKFGQVLETMTITWSTDLEKPVEIIHKALMLLMLPKASSKVTITFP